MNKTKTIISVLLVVGALWCGVSTCEAWQSGWWKQKIRAVFAPKKEEAPKAAPVKRIEPPKAATVQPAAKEKAQAATDGDTVAKSQAQRIEMTKEELVDHIKVTLDNEEEILDMIPELKKAAGADGKVFYTYEGVKLEDIDVEKLRKIFGRVNNEAVVIRTSRIQRQLDAIRQIQAIQRVQQNIPRPPAVPPKPPAPPPSAPQPPKLPQIPSQQSRR